MASDAYLEIDGINGESEDERHRGWMEVQGGKCQYLFWRDTAERHVGPVVVAGAQPVGRKFLDFSLQREALPQPEVHERSTIRSSS